MASTTLVTRSSATAAVDTKTKEAGVFYNKMAKSVPAWLHWYWVHVTGYAVTTIQRLLECFGEGTYWRVRDSCFDVENLEVMVEHSEDQSDVELEEDELEFDSGASVSSDEEAVVSE